MNDGNEVFYLTADWEAESSTDSSLGSSQNSLSPNSLSQGSSSQGSTLASRQSLLSQTQIERPSLDDSPQMTRPDQMQKFGQKLVAVQNPKLKELTKSLEPLSRLVANTTESYSSVIFAADKNRRTLSVISAHTLSRDFVWDIEIPFGTGLVGWTAENKNRISVCPFEHDSRTLQYYSDDQALKSFIAVPILSANSELLGVIACDSKKSYAFSKITEKLLQDCAAQASEIMQLHQAIGNGAQRTIVDRNEISRTIDELREFDDEHTLLNAVAEIPQSVVDRDALVVMTTAEIGIGKGRFYTSARLNQIGHRLLDLVCKHNKVLCPDRSVQAMPTDDILQRSFLSVPFKVFGREAGSFNVLSKSHESFDVVQIEALETIARVVGRELERIRLRDKMVSSIETNGTLSWKHFAVRARLALGEAKQRKTSLSLVRLSINNLSYVEDIAGLDVAVGVMQKLMRLVDQLQRSPAISCYLYGFQILVLMESSEVAGFTKRFCHLVQRLRSVDFGVTSRDALGNKLGELLLQGVQAVVASAPRDGETLEELTARTVNLGQLMLSETPEEMVANAI